MKKVSPYMAWVAEQRDTARKNGKIISIAELGSKWKALQLQSRIQGEPKSMMQFNMDIKQDDDEEEDQDEDEEEEVEEEEEEEKEEEKEEENKDEENKEEEEDEQEDDDDDEEKEEKEGECLRCGIEPEMGCPCWRRALLRGLNSA